MPLTQCHRVAVLLASCFITALAQGAPSAYLPIGIDYRLEAHVDQMFAITTSAPLTKPYRITHIVDSLEQIRTSQPQRYRAIKSGIAPYLANASLVQAGIRFAVDGSEESSLPNRRGLSSSEWGQADVGGVWRPHENILAQAGLTYRVDTSELIHYNSFVAASLGRFQIDVGYKEHWWSPFDHSAMLLSTNARTSPSISFSLNEPLERLWQANFEVFYTELEEVQDGILWQGEFYDGRPRLIGTHLSVKPFQGWQIGFNRLLQFGGGPREISFSDVLKAYVDPVSGDNLAASDDQAGDQLASITSQLNFFVFDYPVELYVEHAGEDTVNNSNLKLGNQGNSLGVFLPELTRNMSLRYEVNTWKTAWYTNSVYRFGNTNDGRVFGHFAADERVFGEGVPADVHSLSLNYFPSQTDFWKLKLAVIDNASSIVGEPTSVDYTTGYRVALQHVRNWRGYRVETGLNIGKTVFDRSYQHFSVALFL